MSKLIQYKKFLAGELAKRLQPRANVEMRAITIGEIVIMWDKRGQHYEAEEES